LQGINEAQVFGTEPPWLQGPSSSMVRMEHRPSVAQSAFSPFEALILFSTLLSETSVAGKQWAPGLIFSPSSIGKLFANQWATNGEPVM
jgi:hypothetical protein